MGVNHLKRDASQVASNSANGGHNSTVDTSGSYGNPPANSPSTRLPKGSGHGFSDRALRTGINPSQPPKGNANGGRGGSKGGQPKVGGRAPRPGMSGGRLG